MTPTSFESNLMPTYVPSFFLCGGIELHCLHNNLTKLQITLVRWNKSLDKIATCDAAGSVIVWKNHNGRSIMELVNNRGVSIADFQWSNDGTRVLISYVDGYVLLGTAFGRRLWARQLSIGSFVTNPASQSQQSRLLSSTWSPDDSKVVVGSSIGELIELDVENGGSLVSTTEVLPGIGIIGLQWVKSPGTNNSSTSNTRDRLSLYLRNGKVVLMSSCGDQQATIIRTGLLDGQMQWNESGSILAVAGYRKSQGISTVRFFKPTGQLLFTLPLNTKVRKMDVSHILYVHHNMVCCIGSHWCHELGPPGKTLVCCCKKPALQCQRTPNHPITSVPLPISDCCKSQGQRIDIRPTLTH